MILAALAVAAAAFLYRPSAVNGETHAVPWN